MKFKDLLRNSAKKIYPEQTVDELCRNIEEQDSQRALREIMAQGGEFLGPYWIGTLWGVKVKKLNDILNRSKL